MNARAAAPVITLFVESRAKRGADAGCYTDEPGLAGQEWRSELREHAGLRLALRVDERHPYEAGERIEGSVVALPYYVGVKAMLRRLPALVAAVDTAVKESDVVVVKLPGVIGLIAVARAKRRKKPIAVQLVGDIAEVLRAGVAGRIGAAIAPVAASATRRAVRQGAVVRYVTERVLQERYPSRRGAVAIAYSDVRVDFRNPGDPAAAVPGRVIAVGSQEQLYKGHQTLIEAIATLSSADPRVHLELIGDGRFQPQLRALANARGIGDRVRFAGHVSDRAQLRALLDHADVFAMPSLTEGMPRALIEAMARGLPCVGSDVGGIPELLPASALIRPGDVDGLARLLRRTLDESTFRAQLQEAGSVTAARFRPEELEIRRQKWSHAVAAIANRDMRATVVHLIGSLDRGGAEMVALDLCRRIPPDELLQVFVCLSGRVGSMAGAFEAAGAEVEAGGFTSPLGAARVVRAAVRRHRADAVVSHVSLASGWLLAAAWSAGASNRIARLHSEGDGRDDGIARRAYRAITRAMLVGSASRIVAVSRASLRFGLGRWAPLVRRKRAFVLGNGVDTDRFTPRPARISEDLPRVIHIGRGSPEKNRAALGPIFRALDRTRQTQWWIVGPGEQDDLGVIPSERFEVLGDRADIPDLLRSSDVLVLPSLREGLPGVILEALSTGVPVVASDLATLRELAAQLQGITLVSPHAAPEVWAQQIATVLATKSDPVMIRGSVVDSRYTLERSVRDWRRLLRID